MKVRVEIEVNTHLGPQTLGLATEVSPYYSPAEFDILWPIVVDHMTREVLRKVHTPFLMKYGQ